MRVVVVSLVLAGCGDSAAVSPDAPNPDAFSTTMFGGSMPQVVGNTSRVLAAPKVVAITYDNDTNRADIEAFFAEFAASTAWAEQTAEFGVGPLTVGTPQHLAGDAPSTITDDQVRAILRANLTGATPAWGQLDDSTLYTFFFPNGTILDDGTGSLCCTDYDGYHFDAVVGTRDIAYAIQCTCPGFDGPTIDDLQQITIVAAHETVEAATNPRGLGFATADNDHVIWTYVNGGELADMCTFVDTTYWVNPPDMHYAIQRSWSNAAAKEGHDPCVGEAQSPYYQTIPDLPGTVTIDNGFGNKIATKSLMLTLGARGMLTLRLYADSPTAGPFTVTVDDLSELFGGPKLLAITQPTGTHQVGEVIRVPIQVNAQDPTLGRAEGFQVTTAPASGPATYFFGVIGQ